jgi:hypothetical protein
MVTSFMLSSVRYGIERYTTFLFFRIACPAFLVGVPAFSACYFGNGHLGL